jgi:hypothetical protein
MISNNIAYLQVQGISMKDQHILDLINQVFTLTIKVNTLEKILFNKGVFDEKEYNNEFTLIFKQAVDLVTQIAKDDNQDIVDFTPFEDIRNKYN